MQRSFSFMNLKLIFLFLMMFLMVSGCKTANPVDSTVSNIQKTVTEDKAPTQGKKEVIIAMIPKSLDNPVFLDAKEEGERAARELGIKFEWLSSMQSDPNEQENLIKSLIRQKVDGIVISCVDAGRIKPVINEAVEAGIKVATFDSDSPESNRIFYCGSNNYNIGDECAKALIKALKEKNRENDDLNLLVMSADEASINHNERLLKFKDAAKKAGIKLHTLDTLYCRDDINMAGDMLERYIRKNVKVDVFFSTGGWPLVVPYESMPAFQRWCQNGGTSIVVDSYYPVLDAARRGLADALVGQDFKKMGELSVRNLYKVIMGEKIESKFINTGLETADKNNYETLLETKKRWEWEIK